MTISAVAKAFTHPSTWTLHCPVIAQPHQKSSFSAPCTRAGQGGCQAPAGQTLLLCCWLEETLPTRTVSGMHLLRPRGLGAT